MMEAAAAAKEPTLIADTKHIQVLAMPQDERLVKAKSKVPVQVQTQQRVE